MNRRFVQLPGGMAIALALMSCSSSAPPRPRLPVPPPASALLPCIPAPLPAGAALAAGDAAVLLARRYADVIQCDLKRQALVDAWPE